MDVIFKRESLKFLKILRLYTQQKASYIELQIASIHYETSKFSSIEDACNYVFEFKLKQLHKSQDFEKKLISTIDDGDVFCDHKTIIKRGKLLGLTKKSDYGSQLPLYPTLDILCLQDDEEDKEQKKEQENFIFEF
ncbi:hypothetical protein COBT_000143 [Conglomerata obtusa]